MIDIQRIREDPEAVKEAIATLGAEAPIDEIVNLDLKRRKLLQELEGLRQGKNETSERIGRMEPGDERQGLIDSMSGVNARIKALESALRGNEDALQRAMYEVPNLPDASVPVGADESENVVLREEGRLRKFDFEPLPHWDLGPELGILDFERGVKLSGSRFYILKGAGAKLQRALIQWMLDLHVSDHGYTEIYPPAIVKEQCMWGAGQLPKFADNIYRDVEDDLWLVGTAEIPLTNLHRDEILEAEDLPISYVAYTPCFRREKFSGGRDVRGIKRGHQFDKVEMYKFILPEESYAALEQILEHAAAVCRALEIPYRVVQMVTGDLGFTAAKKYDLELWAPGSEEWLEVSSVSNCEAFQARRTHIRFRREKGAKPEYVHTLNGSGLALPRTLIAVLENYQQADGSVIVPDVLRPYMGGMERIALEN
ncbi:MAG: serine--tRNA ligase [Chloroflexi bacterium]|nr:serine--tRNA ligase [Chloroflexota bacterium]MDK1044290.1 serine--tRNA ligase [Anaerolineales bacterium]MCH8342133.1 serine--tRNA ligase [Chloroflexota bacterium]MCH8875509.1 serine--tRNA ligase [Chloroflexota bacterium]MCI0772650.1 serine--tRNA ligase [Chloroflexota bacterium]